MHVCLHWWFLNSMLTNCKATFLNHAYTTFNDSFRDQDKNMLTLASRGKSPSLIKLKGVDPQK